MTRLLTTLTLLSGALGVAAGSDARGADFPPEARIADRIVAIVNAEPVTLFELRRAAAPEIARAMQKARGNQRVLQEELKRVVNDTLDALIDDILISEQAKEMALTVGPEKIDAHIQKIKTANGWSDEELADELKQLGFASIADYRRHTEREMMKSQVVGMKVASRVKVEDSEVDRAMKAQMSETGSVEERKAAHILIRLDELASPEAEDRAKELLASAREKILKGETTFAQAAKELSDDTNKNAGGDLGTFVRGDFDPDFEKVAFALGKGEISEPFRTRFGVHLVIVQDIRQKILASADEVEAMKRQVRYELREKALARIYGQWVKSLRADAYVQVKDLGLD